MKNQTIGVEIEFTGMTRKSAAQVVAEVLGTESYYIGTSYDTYGAKDSTGRVWKVMSDASIRAELKSGESAGMEYKCELVTPILRYDDIDTLQEIVRALRKAGARVNGSCGIHVHIGAQDHTARTLKNLTNIMASKENLIYKALQVGADRQTYCKKTEERFIRELNSIKVLTMSAVRSYWYNGHDEANVHYSNTRYHALNLHSVFSKGTVEYRMFNSTMHAGKVKAYIQLCLAVNHQALTQKSANYKATETTNDKYTFRTWLLRLGMIGDEYKTARLHLLENLSGNSAWRAA